MVLSFLLGMVVGKQCLLFYIYEHGIEKTNAAVLYTLHTQDTYI